MDECGGNDVDIGVDGDQEFDVVLWCGGSGVGVAAFVWRGVIGELGELLALGVTVAMREEVVGRLGGVLGVDRIPVIGVLGAHF